jgi:hypothetical protein
LEATAPHNETSQANAKGIEMKKAGVIGLLLSIPIVLFIVLAFVQRNQPPVWQEAIQGYLDYRSTSSAQRLQVLAADKATKPSAFGPEMSSGIFDHSAYYRPDQGDSQGSGQKEGQGLQAGYQPEDGRRALPYPPKSVWCVVVETPGGNEKQLLYVAEHQDLYNTDLVVHEGPKSSTLEGLNDQARRIGCEFG